MAPALIAEVEGLDEYRDLAIATMVGQDEMTLSAEVAGMLNALMGLAGEGGEALDLMKKVLFHGHPLDEETLLKLDKEVGDVLWYTSQYSHYRGRPLSELAGMNIAKLRQRYGSKFSTEASIGRVAD